jgi:hypothetical protein
VDRCGRDHLVFVVHQLRQAVLGVADARLEQAVAAADLLLERQVLEHGHHALAHRAGQQVVEVLEGARARTRLAVLDCPARGGDVRVRVDEREQPVHAVSVRASFSVSERASSVLRATGSVRRL